MPDYEKLFDMLLPKHRTGKKTKLSSEDIEYGFEQLRGAINDLAKAHHKRLLRLERKIKNDK